MSPVLWSKGVSRSFYLSLRLLPAPMREAAALGYLLARTSDTVADSSTGDLSGQVTALGDFSAAVAGTRLLPSWPAALVTAVADPRERLLLGRTAELISMLQALPAAQAALVREVVATITSGQALDLTRFASGTASHPLALPDDVALEDYTWRVAGCVGEFWTRLGRLTMGDGFSTHPEAVLLPLGRRYGMGLQLVNILRDLPADLAAGRCYLPVADPLDRPLLLECHARWLQRAREWVAGSVPYSASLPVRRLRAATRLPGLLAGETLDLLADASWESLQARVKVPRRRVYQLLLRAWFGG